LGGKQKKEGSEEGNGMYKVDSGGVRSFFVKGSRIKEKKTRPPVQKKEGHGEQTVTITPKKRKRLGGTAEVGINIHQLVGLAAARRTVYQHKMASL